MGETRPEGALTHQAAPGLSLDAAFSQQKNAADLREIIEGRS